MNKEFTTNKLNSDGINTINGVKQWFDDLLNQLIKQVPESRELSITRTKLEEACFFAVKAVANDPKNQQA